MLSRLSSVFSLYKGLPLAVYALMCAQTLSAMGAFVDPFLTLLLTTSAGFSPSTIGWIIGSLGLCSIVGSVLGGWVSDNHSHRAVLLTGTAITGLSYFCAGFVVHNLFVLFWIALANVGIGMTRPASSAITAEITPKEKRQLSFSLIHMGVNLGFAFGPLIASLFVHTHPNWIFWGDGLTTLCGLGIITYGTRNLVYLSDQNNSAEEQPMEGSIFHVLRSRPKILLYMMGSILFGLSYGQINFSLPLSLNAALGEDGASVFGAAMATNGIFVLFWTPILATMMWIRPMWALAATGILYGIAFSSYYFIPDVLLWFPSTQYMSILALIIVSSIIWTAGEVCTVSFGSVLLANESPSSHRGRINSSVMVIKHGTRFVTPILIGYVIESFGIDSVWLVAGVASFLASALFFWGRLRF